MASVDIGIDRGTATVLVYVGDRGIVLRDILESGVPMQEKSYTLKAQYFKNGIANFVTNGGFGASAVAEPMRIGTIESGTQTHHDSKPFRVYSPDGKAVTLPRPTLPG